MRTLPSFLSVLMPPPLSRRLHFDEEFRASGERRSVVVVVVAVVVFVVVDVVTVVATVIGSDVRRQRRQLASPSPVRLPTSFLFLMQSHGSSRVARHSCCRRTNPPPLVIIEFLPPVVLVPSRTMQLAFVVLSKRLSAECVIRIRSFPESYLHKN